MVTYASDSGGGNYDPVPEGSHLAVCDMFVDLGLQEGGRFGAKHKVYLRWQIPNLRIEYEKDGEKINAPMTIGRSFTLSLSETSHLRPVLQSWRGKAFTADELKKFDVTTVVGAPCMITVVHTPKEGGGVYANVGVVAKLPGGIAAPVLEGETLIYDADNLDTFEKLRPWMQEKIRAQVKPDNAPEDRGSDFGAGQPGHIPGYDTDLDDDVPF